MGSSSLTRDQTQGFGSTEVWPLDHQRTPQVLTLSVVNMRKPSPLTPAWKTPWMEEPDGLQSMGSLGVGHD